MTPYSDTSRQHEAAMQAGLREGFTTGTAAAAAAAAALRLLLTGKEAACVNVALPPFPAHEGEVVRRLDVAVAFCRLENAGGARSAVAGVVKDGGDDPDATHGAMIEAHVCLSQGGEYGDSPDFPDSEAAPARAGVPGLITLEGGTGVGRVTLPGLPVPVGEAAINPQPRLQIAAAVEEECRAAGYAGRVRVRIVVPDGAERARHTLNGRLGIVGGISVLGTRGTVKPFSHSSWRATITQGMDVARAAGCSGIGLSTGRRSERLLMGVYPLWPERAFIQAADFVAFSLGQAAARGFEHIAWGCFFGKLVKLAQGHAYTHAQTAPLDFALLAGWCADAGLRAGAVREVAGANTARQVLEIVEREGALRQVLLPVTERARQCARHWTGGRDVAVHVFDFDGRLLTQVVA